MYTVDFLKTLHAEDDFVDAIQELIQGFLATDTVKSFKPKTPPASCFASMTMGLGIKRFVS